MLNVLYFAGLKERLNLGAEHLELPPDVVDVRTLLEWLQNRGGVWREALADPRRYRVAVDKKMAKLDTRLNAACEVAIFPPVTGG